jgi:hypothetical protein
MGGAEVGVAKGLIFKLTAIEGVRNSEIMMIFEGQDSWPH